MKTILLIDDDIAIITSLSLLLKKADFKVKTALNPGDALQLIKITHFDLIIQDMNFSASTTGSEGIELLKKIKTVNPNIPVILITAWGSIALAVEGMKLGATDFLNKPWSNEHLLQTIKTILSLSQKKDDQLKLSRKNLDEKFNFDKIIGKSPKLLNILETIGRIAKTDASILITGESGTGKELIAESIHINSNRTIQPFVKVNLGGIPSTLFESEMFGHKKGAFTDAKNDRIGRFEMADKGSIFLDEIGDLNLSNQVKLLRVLQERNFEVLGSSKTKNVDFRLITATNRNLKKMVENSEFREDLFYRINLIIIKLPALRERQEDIPLLVNHFVDNLRTIYRREELSVSNDALIWLKDLPWPGNIRELKNLVERTVLVTNKTVLQTEDFVIQYQASPRKTGDISLPAVGSMTIDELEKMMIKKALEFHKSNLTKVAKSLGLSRAALYRRLEKYEIEY